MNGVLATTTDRLLHYIPEVLVNIPYLGSLDITAYVAAAVLFLVLTGLFALIQKIVVVQLQKLSTKTTTDLDDVLIAAIAGIRSWVYTLVALFASLQLFSFGETIDMLMLGAVLAAVVWQGIEIAGQFVAYGAKRLVEKDEDGDGEVDPNAATASNMVKLLAKIVLWSLGGLFILSNLGIEVTSLIAGLGIGGIAVAFALQGILSDLFASFSLYFDKPFRVGDYIVIGTDAGTVEHIGLKSTRLRTLQGEELVISNAELTTARVHNFKKMAERRIVAHIGITYETPLEKIKRVPDIVTAAFDAVKGGRLDRVHFTTLGDFSLQYEIVYYVESADYGEFLAIQQAFNFELMERLAKESIEFAYPTQLIYNKTA